MPLEVDSTIVTVAEAVVRSLSELELSQDVVPEYFEEPHASLETLPGLRVAIIPDAIRLIDISRASQRREYDISVSVLKKVNSPEQRAQMVLLAEEIVAHLKQVPLDLPELNIRYGGAEIPVPRSTRALRRLGVMLCPATVTYIVLE